MKRKGVAVLFALAALIVPALFASFAQAAPGKNTQDPLQRFVDRVETLQAAFEQQQKDEDGKVTATSSGQLWLARPGRFRWEYQKPYAQLITCDGKTLWMHDPDLEQVTVRPAAASLQGTPVQLLTDRIALTKQFKVEDLGAQGAQRHLRLTPKAADGDFSAIELWMLDGVPQRMSFHSTIGGSTEVSFSGIVLNQKLDAAFFGFKAPAGTEVIQALPESPGTQAPQK